MTTPLYRDPDDYVRQLLMGGHDAGVAIEKAKTIVRAWTAHAVKRALRREEPEQESGARAPV